MDTEIPRCKCTAHVRDVVMISRAAKYVIRTGYTSFALLRCGLCHRIAALPEENLSLALREGTEATLNTLRAFARLN